MSTASRKKTTTAAEPVRYFKTPTQLRAWFEKNHAKDKELWVGYYKKGTGEESVTWPETVDEALCFGWIDGVRKSIDEQRYKIRFSPRKPRSIWSAINIGRMKALMQEGRVQPAGLRAFEVRDEERSRIYSYERRREELDEPYLRKLQAKKKAWTFYLGCAPSYRRAVNNWVVSAKQEATRLKRLEKLIDLCARGELVPPFKPYKKGK